ncbi:BZ3500_MvSof-1268-A1-R1_Chr5-3g08254 [Microbotryum saponariae]|uniref:BZ3500_MvSof-1268-A1-R1_Chr5-3g08254 protein n=1 Tax=Microbotryum saponariae TaxID=289078 RepID=A0A2X0MCS1_9BASI|nr:BZ3500_MvSof-1268-A1-R1_Chr5-3g08254 [Microbotryum saponariae]SDA08362.1 BZ3501_MvSof-1269-A2-R1_Chr5-3g07982 [Microbotryum saponariae]
MSRSSSSSDETRAPNTPAEYASPTAAADAHNKRTTNGAAQGGPGNLAAPLKTVGERNELQRTTTATRHEQFNYFDREGAAELERRLSRIQSSYSTTTQDPTAEDFDFETHLKHLIRKADSQGLQRREIGVTFKDLHVTGEGSGLSYGDTLGSLLSAPLRLGSMIKSMRHPVRKNILVDFTGTVKPGEMLLVLGRPGSGCSSLLKTLSNNTEAFTSVEGAVSFDGASADEMRKHHAGDVAYLPEDDHHLPSLTVGQTLDFAAKTRTPASGARLGSRDEQANLIKDTLVTLFGLRHTLNTKVGNDIIRGVSGGERKRVSIAELLTTGCKIGCHDNSTRGLDASTALEYTRALRIATDISHLTTILSIYQCGQNIFEMFDKVCIIYDGRMVFFGKMGDAVQYFVDMGYEPQPRQTSADFCVAVTDPNGRFVRKGFEGRVPRTAEEFAEHWRKSELGKQNLAEVEKELQHHESDGAHEQLEAFRESAKLEKAKHLSKDSKYLISYPMQVRLACKRRYQLQMGELSTLMVTTIAAIFQALIIGSVYFQMPKNTSGFFSRGGVIFFAILYNSFTGMAEITTAFSQRPIIVRQRQYAMLHPSADMFALNLVDIPFKLVTIFFFDVILYFMSGLQNSASQFFVFLLFTFAANLAMLALFRSLASINRKEPPATMMAGILVLIIAIYVGYTIPRPSMKPWFRWLSYAQPVSFGFEALIANEFRTLDVPCAGLVPSGAGYANVALANQVCTVAGSRTGESIVIGADYLQASFGYTYAHTWRNLGIVLGYFVFWLAVNLISSEFQPDESAAGGVMIFKRGAAPKELENALQGVSDGSDEEAGSAAERVEEHQLSDEEKEKAAEGLKAATEIFTWRDVCYDVQIKGETRRLLDNVAGYVKPGKMTCLMGESGAGKTTLLNVLAQRVTTGVVTGDMCVNGKPLPVSFQRETGYCQQQDTHLATASVREALQFSARLRQPASVSTADKDAYVEEIIKLLEMEAYAEALVGEVGMGLNVEQRKRLTIGVELAAKPALLIFLDEPSSGLDSQSSWSIMQLLRKLADHGQAILATIHQPSSELFQVFDRLLLLKKGGQTVYFGDLGENSETLIKYFGDRSDMKCQESDNPAEYILEVIGAGAGAKTKQDWHALWRESDERCLLSCFRNKTVQREIDEYHREYANKESAASADPDSGRGYAAHTGTQLKIVCQRVFANYYRDSTYLIAKIMLNIVAGLFIGFSFYKTPMSLSGLQNNLFAVFMAVVLAAPLSQQLQPKFIGLRTLYLARERPSRMYNWPVMVFANVVAEIPWNIFAGTLFFLCWYFTCGFDSSPDRAGYAYLLYAVLFELYFASFAQFVAAMSANSMIASVLFSCLFSFVIIFNGVVQPVAQLPKFWSSWMYHLTPFTYLIEGLVANAIGGKTVTCGQQEFQVVVPPAGQGCVDYLSAYTSRAGGYAQVLDNGSCGFCTYRNGDEFLATVGMKYSHRWRDVGIFCAYICFNYFAVFALTYIFSIADFKMSASFFSKKGKKTREPQKQDAEKVEEAEGSGSRVLPL